MVSQNSKSYDALIVYNSDNKSSVEDILYEHRNYNPNWKLYKADQIALSNNSIEKFREVLSQSKAVVFFIGSQESGDWPGNLRFQTIQSLTEESKLQLISALLPGVTTLPKTYSFIQAAEIRFDSSSSDVAHTQLYHRINDAAKKVMAASKPSADEQALSQDTQASSAVRVASINTAGVVKTTFITTAGVVVVGLFNVVLSLLKDGVPELPDATSNSTQARVFQESILVPATAKSGISYMYSGDQPARIEYEAAGAWQAIPENYQGDEFVPKGDTNANGYLNFTTERITRCPNANIGALVVRKPSGDCVASGVKGTFYAEPGDEFAFLLNDTPDMYSDNQGMITVRLYKKAN